MNDYTMDGGQWDALSESANAGNLGEDFAFECNVESDEHLHFRRVGAEGAGLEARVAVMAHGAKGHAVVYFAAPQIRQIAAGLLNLADEIDGTTRLSFVPLTAEEIAEANAQADDLAVTVTPKTPDLPALLIGLAALPVVSIARRFRR